MRWPKDVTVQRSIGTGSYSVCAVGKMWREIQAYSDKEERWRDAYIKVYLVLEGDCGGYNKVETLNDSITDDSLRALIYNTTWAYLGYTEGQPKKVLKALEKVKKAMRAKASAMSGS